MITGQKTNQNNAAISQSIPPRVKWWRELAVIALYLGLALVFTWPLLLHFSEAIPGDGHDGWQMVWNLWWVRYALEHGQNPFQTDLIFYPQGTGLYLHALNALNGLLSLPAQFLTGSAIPGYNFIVLFALTTSAYGAFCLARYLWGNSGAALIAGVAFGFSSYHFDHLLGHLNLISSEFIPFYILFFLKTLNRAQGWLKPALLAVVTLVCGMLLELQYVLYLAIFSLLYLLYASGMALIRKWRGTGQRLSALGSIWGRSALIGLIFLLVTLPLTVPMLNEALNNPNTIPLRQDAIYSTDLLAYFYPSPFHPLWGGTMREVIRPWTATLIEKVVFPGYTIYLLIILGLILSVIQSRRISTSQPPTLDPQPLTPGPFFWALVAVGFGVLSFGRQLHINGVEYGPTLPAALIYKLPILNITRVPARFAVIALLALGLLASWSLSRFTIYDLRFTIKFPFKFREQTGRDKRDSQSSIVDIHKGKPNFQSSIVNRQSSILIVLALAVLIFELWPAPYQLAYYNVPEFYRKLAADKEHYAILDIPMNIGQYQYQTEYMEAQMEHYKPLIGGYISRNPVYPPFYGVPVFWQFSQFQAAVRPDILPAPVDEKAILRYFGVRYVVIHKDLVRGKQQEAALGYAFKLFPQGPVYDAENLVAFEVPPATDSGPLFFANLVQPTWYDTEKDGEGHYSRWVQGNRAGLDLWSDQTRTIEVSLPIWSFHEPHPVELVFNGVSVMKREVGEEPQQLELKLELKPGQNRLDIAIGGKVNRPADLGPGNDTRSLTVGVGEIKFTRT